MLYVVRKQVLATKGLDTGDFENLEAAWAAADALIKEWQEQNPKAVEEHPNKEYTGFPLLDQFWYGDYKGNQGHLNWI